VPDNAESNLGGWLGGATMLFLFAWVIGCQIAQSRDARAIKITDRSLKLTNVHARFVAAVLRERRTHAGDDPDARWRYGDVRDDHDDEPDRI
jgi:hypothetical protein